MALQQDFYGYYYDPAQPAFIGVGDDLYFHRRSRRYLKRDVLDAMMTDQGYTPASGEIDDSPDYAEDILGIGSPYSHGDWEPITASNSGGGTPERRITFGDGPADQAYTITFSGLAVDAVAIDTAGISVPVAEGNTIDQVAAAVASALEGAQDVGATVTVHATAEGEVTVLTATGSDPGNFDAGFTVNIAAAA